MEFFIAAIEVLKTIIILLGCVLGAWGLINLLEAYGSDNPGSEEPRHQAACGGRWRFIGRTYTDSPAENPDQRMMRPMPSR